MSQSLITVYRNGRPAQGVRVVLGYDGISNLGHTKAINTDPHGVAHISHASTGLATVYIDGKDMGKMRTPGNESFYL